MTTTSVNFQTIVGDPDGAQSMVTTAEQLGRNLKQMNLSTSQIRSLFGEVRQIQALWGMDYESKRLANRRLFLLKPKMAYRARKATGNSVQELVNVLDPALDIVLKEPDEKKRGDNFQRFVEFFEAILAYHKASGGN